MITRREYVDPEGRNPFRRWRSGLDDIVVAKISVALERLSNGNTSHVKSVGGGVSELKVDFGPGYRVYFGWDNEMLVILLGGGTKARQQQDILVALDRWRDYKRRRKAGA